MSALPYRCRCAGTGLYFSEVGSSKMHIRMRGAFPCCLPRYIFLVRAGHQASLGADAHTPVQVALQRVARRHSRAIPTGTPDRTETRTAP
jgi:hypothetical protein